ncbi:uncharacterized protein METZ01_LOCUS315911, partial [marine metagenome]
MVAEQGVRCSMLHGNAIEVIRQTVSGNLNGISLK